MCEQAAGCDCVGEGGEVNDELISSSPGTGIAYTCASGHTIFGYIPGLTGNTRILSHPAGYA